MAATVALRAAGVEVTIAERDVELGGIPRITPHTGFGFRDRHRLMSGPRYAHVSAKAVARSGATVLTGTTVLSIDRDRRIEMVGPGGRRTDSFDAVLLATGVRERPRAARLVPGDRPAGVLTTGSLQRLVAAGLPVGARAVVVGAEHVGFSAIPTLRHAGCTAVAIVTDQATHSSHPALVRLTAGRFKVPIVTQVTVASIEGRGRVESVRLSDGRTIECDTVVFSGYWVPDHELAVRSGVLLDPATRGPLVTTGLATSVAGVFAAGNLLRGAMTADHCALEGRAAAAAIVTSFETGRAKAVVETTVEEPVAWVSPGIVDPARTPPRGRFLLRLTDRDAHKAIVRQGDRTLWSGRIDGTPGPERIVSIPANWVPKVDPTSPAPVRIGIAPR